MSRSTNRAGGIRAKAGLVLGILTAA